MKNNPINRIDPLGLAESDSEPKQPEPKPEPEEDPKPQPPPSPESTPTDTSPTPEPKKTPSIPPPPPGKEWPFTPVEPPAAPPGVDVNENMEEAQRAALGDPPLNPKWFYDQVKNKGPWDYKQKGRQYLDFGNFNFGAAGGAFGFPLEILLQEAGRAQRAAGTSRPEWGDPGRTGFPSTGTPPYGDDPGDQAIIQSGYKYFQQWKFANDVLRKPTP